MHVYQIISAQGPDERTGGRSTLRDAVSYNIMTSRQTSLDVSTVETLIERVFNRSVTSLSTVTNLFSSKSANTAMH